MDDFLDEISINNLDGDRVLLRNLLSEDAFSLYKIIEQNRAFLAKHLPWPNDCNSLEDVLNRMENWELQAQMGRGTCFGIFIKKEKDLILAGLITVGWIEWRHRSASISYWLAEKFTGNGYATDSLNLLSKGLFSIGINRLEISCAVNNPKSMALALRSGFKEEGKCREFECLNGIFLDHVRFSRLASDD